MSYQQPGALMDQQWLPQVLDLGKQFSQHDTKPATERELWQQAWRLLSPHELKSNQNDPQFSALVWIYQNFCHSARFAEIAKAGQIPRTHQAAFRMLVLRAMDYPHESTHWVVRKQVRDEVLKALADAPKKQKLLAAIFEHEDQLRAINLGIEDELNGPNYLIDFDLQEPDRLREVLQELSQTLEVQDLIQPRNISLNNPIKQWLALAFSVSGVDLAQAYQWVRDNSVPETMTSEQAIAVRVIGRLSDLSELDNDRLAEEIDDNPGLPEALDYWLYEDPPLIANNQWRALAVVVAQQVLAADSEAIASLNLEATWRQNLVGMITYWERFYGPLKAEDLQCFYPPYGQVQFVAKTPREATAGVTSQVDQQPLTAEELSAAWKAFTKAHSDPKKVNSDELWERLKLTLQAIELEDLPSFMRVYEDFLKTHYGGYSKHIAKELGVEAGAGRTASFLEIIQKGIPHEDYHLPRHEDFTRLKKADVRTVGKKIKADFLFDLFRGLVLHWRESGVAPEPPPDFSPKLKLPPAETLADEAWDDFVREFRVGNTNMTNFARLVEGQLLSSRWASVPDFFDLHQELLTRKYGFLTPWLDKIFATSSHKTRRAAYTAALLQPDVNDHFWLSKEEEIELEKTETSQEVASFFKRHLCQLLQAAKARLEAGPASRPASITLAPLAPGAEVRDADLETAVARYKKMWRPEEIQGQRASIVEAVAKIIKAAPPQRAEAWAQAHHDLLTTPGIYRALLNWLDRLAKISQAGKSSPEQRFNLVLQFTNNPALEAQIKAILAEPGTGTTLGQTLRKPEFFAPYVGACVRANIQLPRQAPGASKHSAIDTWEALAASVEAGREVKAQIAVKLVSESLKRVGSDGFAVFFDQHESVLQLLYPTLKVWIFTLFRTGKMTDSNRRFFSILKKQKIICDPNEVRQIQALLDDPEGGRALEEVFGVKYLAPLLQLVTEKLEVIDVQSAKLKNSGTGKSPE